MKIQICIWLMLTAVSVSAAQNRPPDPHKHVVDVHAEPWNTDLAAEAKVIALEGVAGDMRDSVLSPGGRWLAFVFTTPTEWARVGFQDIRSGKRYQVVNLPLPYRPISDIVWIDSALVAFDRWSQPHYGIHYIVDVYRNCLVLATPFPDEFYLRQQRDSTR
jgi:hypothetical protein